MNKLRVAVLTATRADYGLLYWLIRGLHEDPYFELQLVVTGMHLSPEFGRTVSEIEKDGFPIAARVDMVLSSDTHLGTAKSLGIGVLGLADAMDRLKPDRLVVLGDRYELLSACSVAVALRIPIVHIHGGETTEGAMDEQIRHAVTKMAHLHFVTTEGHRDTVLQMGEREDRVFHFGAPGLEHVGKIDYLSREELEAGLGFSLHEPCVLVSYHPETLAAVSPLAQLEELIGALRELRLRAIFTYSNADPGGRSINQRLEKLAAEDPASYYITPSLGQRRYLSLLKYVQCVVGNSSSGIIEVPSFRKPTVDIGDRQRGRVRAGSIVSCRSEKWDILNALAQALDGSFVKNRYQGINPYENGVFSERAIEMLKRPISVEELLLKSFRRRA